MMRSVLLFILLIILPVCIIVSFIPLSDLSHALLIGASLGVVLAPVFFFFQGVFSNDDNLS